MRRHPKDAQARRVSLCSTSPGSRYSIMSRKMRSSSSPVSRFITRHLARIAHRRRLWAMQRSQGRNQVIVFHKFRRSIRTAKLDSPDGGAACPAFVVVQPSARFRSTSPITSLAGSAFLELPLAKSHARCSFVRLEPLRRFLLYRWAFRPSALSYSPRFLSRQQPHHRDAALYAYERRALGGALDGVCLLFGALLLARQLRPAARAELAAS